jgi:methyl-accepting chemotaxis protein
MNAGSGLNLDFTNFQSEHQYKLLKNLYLLYSLIIAPTVFLYLIFYFTLQDITLLLLVGLNILDVLMLGVGYWFIAQKNLPIGSWILVMVILGSLILTSWAWGTGVPVILGYVFLIMTSFIFLSRIITGVFVFISIVCWWLLYALQNISQWYNPPLAKTGLVDSLSLIAVTLLLIGFMAILAFFWNSQNVLFDFQRKQLQSAFEELQDRQRTSGVMSQQILAVVSQLNSAANQQASGSNQQVNTVSEIGHSVEELSKTARNISDLAEQVNGAALEIDRQSREIEDTATVSVERSESSNTLIQETVSASSSVSEKYQLLLEAMQVLNTKSQDMRRILQLLSSLASETHLLSLNAAIEAAGAGEHGSRFAVVAQETKNLALRSGNASKEVVNIINEIEDTINATFQIAEEGYNTANQMHTASNQSEQVVEEMNSVVKTAYAQATSIRHGVRNVLELAQIIKLATAQQQSSSQQVLQAIRELSAVAQQFAQNSNTLSSSADSLEGLSNDLNVALVA